MKTRRYVNSKRRNFKRIKKNSYIKSRKNKRKIMKGGAAENIGASNISLLDNVGQNGNPFKMIVISRIFNSESDAIAFIDNAKTSIGTTYIINPQHKPYGKEMTTIQVKQPRRFLPDKIVDVQVPAKYIASFGFVNNPKGIKLAKELIAKKGNLPLDERNAISVTVN